MLTNAPMQYFMSRNLLQHQEVYRTALLVYRSNCKSKIINSVISPEIIILSLDQTGVPTQDIRQTERVFFVMKEGVTYKNERK